MLALRHAAVLLAAAAVLSACGGGGGGGRSARGVTAPTAPCIQTHMLGCLTPAAFGRQVDTYAANYRRRADFTNQWGLATVRADRAWALLEIKRGAGTAPGGGQTAGVIDTGIDTGHPVFAGKTVTEEFLSGAVDETGAKTSHGTAVAGVIVGRPSTEHTAAFRAARGVAWGADVAMFAIPLSSSNADDDPYRPVSLATLAANDPGFKAVIDRVLAWSSGGRTLDFVNMSFGFNGIVDMYSTAGLRSNYDETIAALAQAGAADKTVFIRSAGNAHGDPCDPDDFTGHADLCESYDDNGVTKHRVNAKSVEVMAGLPVLISELRGIVVAVVAVGSNGRIASFSNRCGSAAQWCIAAPGVAIRTAFFGPASPTEPGARGAYSPNGTSFSAPMVTGALIVMKHYFRSQLSNTALAARMLATANDRGVYATRSIYGHGLLDLEAALTPVGGTTVALGNAVGGPGSPVTQTRFNPGSAFGNALSQSFAGQEVAAFDELGAPFWYRLGGFARTAPRAPAIDRLNAFMAPSGTPVADGRSGRRADQSAAGPPLLGGFVPAPRSDGQSGSWSGGRRGVRPGYLDAPPNGREPGANGGHLALANRALAFDAEGPGGLGLTAFSTEGLRNRAPVSGAMLSWSPAPDRPGARGGGPLRFTGGWIAERETMLGSRASGAFGRLSSGSAFAGFEGAMQAGAWRLDASAEFGTAYAAAGGGMLTGLSPVHSSAFAVRAGRSLDANASLRLSVSQPLRVESGRARFSIPVGRTKEGAVLRRSLSADLAPAGRQLDLSAR